MSASKVIATNSSFIENTAESVPSSVFAHLNYYPDAPSFVSSNFQPRCFLSLEEWPASGIQLISLRRIRRL